MRSAANQSKPSSYGRNTNEAAAYLGVSESWLTKLRCVGGGPRYAKLGRRVVYQDSDLDAWREQYVTTSTADIEVRRKPAFPATA
jgi:predicted DNA-binding transcriptional regulator AlpA